MATDQLRDHPRRGPVATTAAVELAEGGRDRVEGFTIWTDVPEGRRLRQRRSCRGAASAQLIRSGTGTRRASLPACDTAEGDGSLLHRTASGTPSRMERLKRAPCSKC